MNPTLSPSGHPTMQPQTDLFTRSLLGANPLYRRLVLRNAIGSVPYWVSMLLIGFSAARGAGHTEIDWALSAGMLLTVLGFHIALRSGWSQRFKDPSLALAGILMGMTWTMLVYMFAPAIHATQLLILLLVLALGVFNLNATGILLTSLYGLAGIGAAIAVMTRVAPEQYPPRIEFLYFAMLLICMPCITAVGMQRVKLTHKLKQQKAELATALSTLKELAIRDELTGLYNRGHMIALMQHAVDRQQRTGERFSLVMFDLDYFKRVNDTHGHGVGDDVLRSFASIATTILRKSDVLARWGGEEFVAVCPHTDDPQASVGIERLLKEWSSAVVSPQAPELRVSFSAGLTTYQAGETIDATIQRADQALYTAKDKGRNCIVQV